MHEGRIRYTRYSKYVYANTAKIIARAREYAFIPETSLHEALLLTIATHFADLFQQDNPRFDRTRFLIACKGENSEQS